MRPCICNHRFRRLPDVGQARSVAKINVVGIGNEAKQSLKHSQAAKARVENADAGSAGGHEKFRQAALILPRKRSQNLWCCRSRVPEE